MYTALYVSNGIGFALMVMLLITNRDHLGKEKRTRYLIYMAVITMTCCLCEIAAAVLDGKPGMINTVILYIVNSILFLGVITVSYFWVQLECKVIGASISKTEKLVHAAIDSIGVAILIANLFCPMVFSLENNVYKREPLYWIFVFIGLINITFGHFIYYRSMKKGKLLMPFSVTIFTVPMLIGIIVQTLFYGVSVIWVGVALAIASVASSLKNSLIFIDSLTHVYNSYFLQKKGKDYDGKDNVQFIGIMIDINDFKKINDSFGHNVGDEALVVATDIFTKVLEERGTVIRSGGDEFVIILDTTEKAEADEIIGKINRECEEINKKGTVPYQFSVSAGWDIFDSSRQSFDDFLRIMDAEMYKKKQEYHSLHGDNYNLKRLGAFPVSTNILEKSNIGLWAVEMDDGEEPRMYADETMRKLLGLTENVSPEQMYHEWVDRFDTISGETISEAATNMIAGEHIEFQCPWHHPDGRTVMMRCGGVRNPQYKAGIRIEGVQQDVSKMIRFNEEKLEESKRQKRELAEAELRIDALKYVADNEPDLNSFLEFFGKRILEIADCDQVIYRDVDGTRAVVNALGVGDIPQEICLECPFTDFQGADYGDSGTVVMNNCKDGFRGVQTNPQCPVKSSLMTKVYSDGKLKGLLTIHYLREYHTFTEEGTELLKAMAKYLGLLIGRVEARQNNIEKIKAESSNKAKTEFLFNMSHDIRTPMNAIIGFTSMAKDHSDDKEKLADCLDKIQQSSNLLLSLINSVLEVSRIESGNGRLNEQAGDAFLCFAPIEQVLKASAEAKDIDLTFEFGDIKDRYVYCDIDKVNRILVNIISNAIKYTQPGGYVKVRCDQVESDKEGYANIRVTCEDNGIGMSEEFQKHAFEHFAREQNSTASGIQGTGLGLTVCKSFADLMGGTIECRSELGKGTTFTVTIPFRIQEGEMYTDPYSHLEKDASTDSGDGDKVDFQGMKALVVEDNELNLEITKEILADKGIDVESAADGSIAVNMLREKGAHYYDFILMDIQMPVMNGYEATKEIRRMYPDERIPIIAVSANAFAEDKKASIEAQMDDHIAKPIVIDDLFYAVSRILKDASKKKQ